jgi:hypothetical protein
MVTLSLPITRIDTLLLSILPLSIKTASRVEMRPKLQECTERLKHSDGYPIKWFYNDKQKNGYDSGDRSPLLCGAVVFAK